MPVISETNSPLDANQHLDSISYTPVFTGAPLSLETKLSWVKRFTGDENFNSEEVLPGADNAMTPKNSSMEPDSNRALKLSSSMDGSGVIKGLRLADGKIKISHGPIDKYGMPAMTMMFKVKDISQLDNLKKDQKIEFDVDNSSGGFVITKLMPILVEETKSEKQPHFMDAQGEVTAIKATQGKVKIKHGPIDKFGMPAMTMVFKLSDKKMIENLKKGSMVQFDIDNSSGGFVITDIVTVEE